jgi:hypothetical protein
MKGELTPDTQDIVQRSLSKYNMKMVSKRRNNIFLAGLESPVITTLATSSVFTGMSDKIISP